MQSAKEILQKLAPVAEASLQAAAIIQAAAACSTAAGEQSYAAHDDNNACIVCLDCPVTVIFNPCGHCVTCAGCAELLVKAKQPCPLCRGPAVAVS